MKPELIVLHYTAMLDSKAALKRLCDRKFEVSAHYLIAADGTLFQLVAEAKRAWHAGAGTWRGRQDINSRSIGIELDNDGSSPFPEHQMVTLERLLIDLMKRWQITAVGVIAHSDFALGRKSDPGRKFDWYRLAHQGLSVWPTCTSSTVPDGQAFATAAASFGYPSIKNNDDKQFKSLLNAFRLRFAPWRRGGLCNADMSAIEDLALRFGSLDPSTRRD